MKSTVCIAAALAALAFAAAPAAAGTPHQDFRAWLGHAIEANMVFPRELEQNHVSGVATVRFHVDGSGRTTGAEIVESSGERAIDRAALQTIRRLALPANAPAGPHLAVLQYGTEVGLADAAAHRAQMGGALGRAELAAREIRQQRQAYARSGRSAARSTID
ncbi:energy transducer TonB [Sphingosinicella terrae]|uniref:energy transducer TonB n=1 Tax=Sphingosinicella terrae TaxID=2172047 RepID=UPI0025486015|nr:TonB family protein [Sphingosinicella terrae]